MTADAGPVRVTVLVGGHPFDGESFTALWASLADVTATIVAWPEAERVFEHGGLDSTDVLVLYDMPGVGFRADGPPIGVDPPDVVKDGWARLLADGFPVVAMHHSLASWPAWPGFADIVGGRFHYAAATLNGIDYPDSGYRHDVNQTLTIAAHDHPVCAGLPESFDLTDETYLCPVFADDVVALLTTDAPLDDLHHYSATAAVAGRMHDREGWSHPPGHGLAAWTHMAHNSTIVYIQPGDGPTAFEDPNYRRLLHSAITWVAETRPPQAPR